MTRFIRLIDDPTQDKSAALRAVIARGNADGATDDSRQSVDCDPSLFSGLPGSPFTYWINKTLLDLFAILPSFESGDRKARVGLQTSDDGRFARAHWEVPGYSISRQWSWFVKGGRYSPYYCELPLVANWGQEGREMKAFAETTPGTTHWSRNLRNTELFSRAGLTWPLRGSRLSAQAVPRGCIFSIAGKMAFTKENDLLVFLALFNSAVFTCLLRCMSDAVRIQFEVGLIQLTPVPNDLTKQREELSTLARRAWLLRRSLDADNENSIAFVLPRELRERSHCFNAAAIDEELTAIQHQIDDVAFAAYEISSGARAIIESSFNNNNVPDELGQPSEVGSGEDLLPEVGIRATNEHALNSWLFGIAFGRFDPRLATGERSIPPEPEPFDPLPSRSPGMYPEGEDPADRPDILVDDEGHPKDLTAHVQRCAEYVGVEVPADLRAWFAHEFFPLHIKMYSKSRRKAPIYWQLATPSASYSVWLYIHAFTKDTLFRVQNDYVTAKLAHEERQLETLRAEAGPDPVTAQRKAIEAQESFVEELRAFLEEVKRVAPLWNPNLDDGVIINFAPLWRLVPHHKPWQKELKSTWDALCAGKYDWAHLAMHLWPERVAPKCAEDRSLAIAHGLEDLFWHQDDDEKWKPRERPTTPVHALVKERRSDAVKAALKSLLEATEAASSTRRGRRGRG